MKQTALVVTILASMIPSITAFAQCSPNKRDFGGSDVLKTNWTALSSLGLTRELHPSGSPKACERLSLFKSEPPQGLKGQASKTQRCLTFADYGVGSFDPVHSNHCKHNTYIAILFEETPTVWKVFDITMRPHSLAGEFDKNGRSVKSASDAPTATTSQPDPPPTGSVERSVKDLLKRLPK